MGPDASESSVARTTCPTPGSDERIAASRGVRGFPDGGSSLSAGPFSLSEGSFSLSEGSFSLSEGSFSLSEGSFSLSEGSFSLSEGSFLLSEGSFSLSEGSFSLSESLSRMAAMAHWAPLICFATNSSRSARYRI